MLACPGRAGHPLPRPATGCTLTGPTPAAPRALRTACRGTWHHRLRPTQDTRGPRPGRRRLGTAASPARRPAGRPPVTVLTPLTPARALADAPAARSASAVVRDRLVAAADRVRVAGVGLVVEPGRRLVDTGHVRRVRGQLVLDGETPPLPTGPVSGGPPAGTPGATAPSGRPIAAWRTGRSGPLSAVARLETLVSRPHRTALPYSGPALRPCRAPASRRHEQGRRPRREGLPDPADVLPAPPTGTGGSGRTPPCARTGNAPPGGVHRPSLLQLPKRGTILGSEGRV